MKGVDGSLRCHPQSWRSNTLGKGNHRNPQKTQRKHLHGLKWQQQKFIFDEGIAHISDAIEEESVDDEIGLAKTSDDALGECKKWRTAQVCDG